MDKTLIISDESYQISVLAACIGRVTNHDYTDILESLLDQMTVSEKDYFRQLYRELRFSGPGVNSPL